MNTKRCVIRNIVKYLFRTIHPKPVRRTQMIKGLERTLPTKATDQFYKAGFSKVRISGFKIGI